MKQINEMTDKELMGYYEATDAALEETDACKAMIKDEFMDRLDEQKVNSKIIGDWSVTKITKNKITASLEKAREFGCVKTEEKVDSPKANRMIKAGVELPHEVYSYLLAKKLI